MARETDPIDRQYDGVLRNADGDAPYNGHWWARGDDRYALFTRRYPSLFLGVIALNNGAFLAGHCASRRDAQHPTRAAALAADVKRLIREIRRSRKVRRAGKRHDWGVQWSYSPMTPHHEATVLIWLYKILIKEFGERRRWVRGAILARAVLYEEDALWELGYASTLAASWARQLAGDPNGSSKKAQRDYDLKLQEKLAFTQEHYAPQLLRAALRASRCTARVDRLRGLHARG